MLAGLIGNDIRSSVSPPLHEAEARNCGFDLEYRLHDFPINTSAEELGRFLKQIEDDGAAGVNVTHPFKR